MILLTFFYLLSTFPVAESTCSRKAPRREGFLRHKCVPGFYEGSCLIILEKLPFHNATESCRYDYGGRLATAPTEEALQLWSRTIHFDSKITVNKDTRFWVGYGVNLSRTEDDSDYFGFKYDEPDEEMQKFINLTMWNRVFGEPRTSADLQWEYGADRGSLVQYKSCPDYGVVFNPNNMKFDVKSYHEEHYALCETPRWAKLQCDEGWHLIPQLRMCLKVHYNFSDFLIAHEKCREDKSFISVAQDFVELEMLRAVIVPYGKPPRSNVLNWNSTYSMAFFWTGVKTMNHTTFSLDGTKPIFTADTPENKCCAHSYSTFEFGSSGPKYGMTLSCEDDIPYMCQRFADQS